LWNGAVPAIRGMTPAGPNSHSRGLRSAVHGTAPPTLQPAKQPLDPSSRDRHALLYSRVANPAAKTAALLPVEPGKSSARKMPDPRQVFFCAFSLPFKNTAPRDKRFHHTHPSRSLLSRSKHLRRALQAAAHGAEPAAATHAYTHFPCTGAVPLAT